MKIKWEIPCTHRDDYTIVGDSFDDVFSYEMSDRYARHINREYNSHYDAAYLHGFGEMIRPVVEKHIGEAVALSVESTCARWLIPSEVRARVLVHDTAVTVYCRAAGDALFKHGMCHIYINDDIVCCGDMGGFWNNRLKANNIE